MDAPIPAAVIPGDFGHVASREPALGHMVVGQTFAASAEVVVVPAAADTQSGGEQVGQWGVLLVEPWVVS